MPDTARKSIKLANGRTIDLTRGEFDEIAIRSEWAVLSDDKKPAPKHPSKMSDAEFATAVRNRSWLAR
jgi:hypothetical protein